MSADKDRISPLRTVGTFAARGTCSQTLLCVLNEAFGNPCRNEERACDPLAGGIMQYGYQCGMLWGAALAAGAEAHRRFGAGPVAEARAIDASRRIVEAFRTQNGHTDCHDFTGIDESASAARLTVHFLLKGGAVDCFRMAARYAPLAHRELEAAFSEGAAGAEAPPAPVSCASELARRMGATEARAMAVAGLAGGIGLCGGGCGALAAALWLGWARILDGGGKVELKPRWALVLVDRFEECAGYELECSAIVGRRFEGVADHAGHLARGGCAKLLDVLAAAVPPAAAGDGAAPGA
jgi:hypothetical protein